MTRPTAMQAALPLGRLYSTRHTVMGQIIKEQVMSSHLYFSSQQYDYSFSRYMCQTFEAFVKRPAKAQPGSAILCCLYSSLVCVLVHKLQKAPPPPPPGGTPLYGLYRYVRPQRVWFFSRFGYKYGNCGDQTLLPVLIETNSN